MGRGPPTDTGGVYDPATDSWTPTAGEAVPPARRSHTAVYTGSEMLIWGGEPLSTELGAYCAARSGAPIANAGPDQVLECTGDRLAMGTLDGSRSSDPDSTPGTYDDIVSFDWSEEGTALATGESVRIAFEFGVHTVELTVANRAGLSDTERAQVNVSFPQFGEHLP